ncbi:hypothetical protein BT96DRAFT_462336 [Gymnopus androsaceus JB14]|uniref:F-box domain-containing protein n=1 Tax=Gymnopus androsaceus JB14 TaxID=1447944 RepID=A0A6A4IH43_9AGAR|nr:hypothetical protein BT96DRAFT_462336 [Gymnopus androsaceus JB14]
MATFLTLPVELIADVLSELDLESLITISYLSRRLHDIVSDPSLNPWRKPILHSLRSGQEESVALKHLSVRQIVPRHNWIEILSLASPSFILLEATLPNLKSEEWEECFNRRFLPGWRKWLKDGSWKAAFLGVLHRVYHRSRTSCTSEESWTKYIVLNRNGTANELEAASRGFNPLSIFNEMKLQSNLMHLETRIRLVVQLADVRILAFGTLDRPRSTLTVNPNAHTFLHPPGIDDLQSLRSNRVVTDHGVYPLGPDSADYPGVSPPSIDFSRLTHPLPAPSHRNYPWYTPGGGDKRWLGSGEDEEEGLKWVGGLMIIAQILTPKTHEIGGDWLPLQDLDLVVGAGRSQYASLTWNDLWAIAPWMEERIANKIDGPGLGL